MNMKKIMVLALAFLMVMPKAQAMGDDKIQQLMKLAGFALGLYGMYMQYKQYKMMNGQTISLEPLQSKMNFEKLNRDIHIAMKTLALFYKFPDKYEKNYEEKDVSLYQSLNNWYNGVQKYKKPLSGIVLHGKPGSGKTELVRALAGQGVPVFALSGSEIKQSLIGSAEATLRNIYNEANSYRYGKLMDYESWIRWILNMPLHPLVCVFLDEIDSFGQTRGANQWDNAVLNQLLTLLDGSKKYDNIVTIVATNRLDSLDEALLRSKRLGVKIKIDDPTKEEKLKIINSKFDGTGLKRTTSLDNFLKNGLENMTTSDLIELPELCKTIKCTNALLEKPKNYRTIGDDKNEGKTIVCSISLSRQIN